MSVFDGGGSLYRDIILHGVSERLRMTSRFTGGHGSGENNYESRVVVAATVAVLGVGRAVRARLVWPVSWRLL